MNENTETEHSVVVQFPASRSFKIKEQAQNPIPALKKEVEKKLDLREKTGLNLPPDIDNLNQVCSSLEVRLKVLEEVNSRLNFYLNDIESELSKK